MCGKNVLSSRVVRVGYYVLSVEKLAQLSPFTIAPVGFLCGGNLCGVWDKWWKWKSRSRVGRETETNSDYMIGSTSMYNFGKL